ncbi:uncharacterized protein PV09_03769 [Verruconis gallopava]|uniref:Mitochondrial thiamine pyrophosphate carrier 1 n=1 Tax=Verruconis gallopava TaxID=253628 RepID=A0A0D1XRA7_9PEZI|nr:uncharacterized protein PV09_03769 [Verruconis gallopava]KIW05231.1 hypothetical protein PV09_03769 [Verruconis gallopava]
MPLTPEQHRRPKKEDLPPWPKEFDQQLHWIWRVYRRDIATAAASATSIITTYPLDTIKTNMQTDPKYTSVANIAGRSRIFNSPTVQCCLDMFKRGGIREFYRGAIPPFFGVGIYRLLNMGAYRESKWAADNLVYAFTGVSPLAVVNTVGSKPTAHTVICFTVAGAMAGAASSVYTSPMELIKYAQQLAKKIAEEKTGQGMSQAEQRLRQSYGDQRSMIAIGKIIHKNFTWRGFYFGFKYHLVRDTFGGAFYFGTYEWVKHTLGPQQGREASHGLSVFFAGLTCGAVSSAVLMPYDTAKSRYQKECLSSVTRPTFPEYSWVRNLRANYPGFAITIARSGLTHGIFFFTYESIKRYIESESFGEAKKL